MFGNEMMHGRVPDKPHAWHATTDTILTLLHLPDTILSLACRKEYLTERRRSE